MHRTIKPAALHEMHLYGIATGKRFQNIDSVDLASALTPRLQRSVDALIKRLGTDDADVIAALILYIESL